MLCIFSSYFLPLLFTLVAISFTLIAEPTVFSSLHSVFNIQVLSLFILISWCLYLQVDFFSVHCLVFRVDAKKLSFLSWVASFSHYAKLFHILGFSKFSRSLVLFVKSSFVSFDTKETFHLCFFHLNSLPNLKISVVVWFWWLIHFINHIHRRASFNAWHI